MPSPLGRTYKVRIDYQQGGKPKVFVDSPDLTILAGGRKLPHVYEQKPTWLCLYLPKQHEWQPWMPLDEYVVPWTAVWLYFFEDWLATDEWRGGGVHRSEVEGESLRQGSYLEALWRSCYQAPELTEMGEHDAESN